MTDSNSGLLRQIKVPALITLAVTAARLIGELLDGSELLFGSSGGGGLSLVGIAWLIPVVGFWFGYRYTEDGHGPDQPGSVLMSAGLSIAVAVVATILLNVLIAPVPPMSIVYTCACAAGASLLMLPAWPRVFFALFLYGLAARIPVIVITFVAVRVWPTTHYARAPAGLEGGPNELAGWLSLAQLGVWVPATIVLGGLAASLGAMFSSRRRAQLEANT